MARACVITGAGRGLGRALAVHLATAGYEVALCARSTAEIEDAVREIEQVGGRASGHTVDVSDPNAVDELASRITEQHGPVWAAVNNAGVLGPVGPVDAVDAERWMQAIAVDIGGVFAVTRAFVPQMRRSGGGRVVNLSGAGIGGPRPLPRVSAYTASKAAVDVLTEALAPELIGDGITINAVAPGPTPTAFLDDVLHAGPDLAGPQLHDDAVRNHDATGCTDSFFALVHFLLGEESSWLTGKLLSARWDRVDDLVARRDQLVGTSLMTLRRIDDVLFTEVDQ
ncbi:MAG TPA: SDR family oxidoreductase [Acidimicrobiia bacterium]|nr:SDR family oxidoreductase [Acidimicrobiia bacterium]